MTYCSHCGAQLPEGARFCSTCRTPVPPARAGPPVARGWSQRTRRTIFLGFGLFMLVGIIYESGKPKGSSSSSSTPAVAILSKSTPTLHYLPTAQTDATPGSVVLTPTFDQPLNDGPGAGPIPTDDVVARNRADVAVYMTKIMPIMTQLGAGLDGITKESNRVSGDSSLLLDHDWKVAIGTEIALVTNANRQFLQVQPVPGPAQEFNGILARATQMCSDSANTLATGIDTMKAATISVADDQMVKCGALIHESVAEKPQN